ncbi:segregation and condensation protein A [Haliovirga abyssi]|uniref:Segregation and condensation protein A n=1 Tax=Haliovirga abyssi TaxID=2996794 RepID=A0AAU9D834_9FUSO|nr:segregation/condensation protein A [Haliovirga abyssi]BDU50748.1 segregation/condensation protein A [Haliovirga abyssi]
MEIKIKLDNFEGPLDLLLHLVEKNKVEIYSINISKLIDDYLSIINKAKESSLKIKVEFLNIAVELLEIKSLAILNKREKKEKEEELEKRIAEYKFYKELANEIRELENIYNISYTKTGEPIKNIINRDIDLSNLTTEKIYETYINIKSIDKSLNKKNNKLVVKSDNENSYTLEEAIYDFTEKLEKVKSINLKNLFYKETEKIKKVIKFLAVLELYKMKKVIISLSGYDYIISKRREV